ncbi:MAG: hypothetical protein GXY77_11135 [Fibrobacter sp.]|nr:hypothetical protein [Fibrobacter sp.]
MKKIILFLTAIGCILFFSCASRSALRKEKLADSTRKNEFLPAVDFIKKNPKLYGRNNELLYNLDIGILYHYEGMHDSSNSYLLNAINVYHDLFARSVTNEVASMLVNDNVRPYRSRPYELTFLHQVVAFNFLAFDKVHEALVETRRMQLLFDEWERKNRTDEKYTSDGMFHFLSSIVYDAAGESDNAMISLFKSVKAYKNGPVKLPSYIQNYAYNMFKLNDRESDNELLKLEPPKVQVPGVDNNISEIVFIGYSGKGPSIEEAVWSGTYVKDGLLVVHHKRPDGKRETMSLPAPPIPESELKKAEKGKKTKSGTTFHIKFALPVLKTHSSKTKAFKVHCDGYSEPFTTTVINDFDLQVAKNLEDTKAATLARTVARVVIRTITTQQTKGQLTTNNPLANILINVGTDVLADQLEKADTRSCFLLPKTVQIARIPVKPGVYTIDVAAMGGAGEVLRTKKFSNIKVGTNQKKFVFYSSFE